MDWRGILVGQGVPVARLLRGSSPVEAFPGGGSPITIPGNGFLRSYSVEGALLPPVFDPQSDPTAANEATLFGSVDAPETVLRVARRSPVFTECYGGQNAALPCIEPTDCPGGTCAGATCVGGGNDGTACTADSGCPGGECGPSLFDFQTRYVTDTGPVVLPRFGAGVCQAGTNAGLPCATDAGCAGDVCVRYRVVAKDPVPLEGLNQTQDLNAFVVSEGVDGKDLNGNGDAKDDVLLLADRNTGQTQAFGDNGASGRATVRVHEPPFSFPAVAVENDVVAFLEPEALQGNCSVTEACDRNGDGDVADTILRVERISPLTDRLSGLNIAVDADPQVNQRSVAISNGFVFVRRPEAAGARQKTQLVSGDASFSITGDGRFVAFNAFDGIEMYDRVTAGTTLIVPVGNSTVDPRFSANGRFVVFVALSDIIPEDSNNLADVYIYDRDTDENGIFDEPGQTRIELISVSSTGVQGNGASGVPYSLSGQSVSDDGRFVVFQSAATNLVADDVNGQLDVFLRDRLMGQTILVSRDSPDFLGGIAGQEPDISADGRFVAFENENVYVYDRMTGQTTLETPTANGNSSNPFISGDGDRVAFWSGSSTFVAGDTNDRADVFVRYGASQQTVRATVSSAGEQGNGVEPAGQGENIWLGDISDNGRYVAFQTDDSNLVADDTNGEGDHFVHDLVTGLTVRVNLDTAGDQGTGELAANGAHHLVLSADGQVAAFRSVSTNLVPGLVGTFPRVFVRGPDPADLANDFSGDGALDDTVLTVVDSGSMSSPAPITNLCPANEVAVNSGRAAFLRPESAGVSTAAACSGPDLAGPDLNGDGDSLDQVVHLWSSATGVVNLRCAATAVVLSDTYLAALVSEAGQEQDLNGDGDQLDNVVMVHRIADGDPGSCAGWINTHQAADSLDISGSMVAFLTPEAAQGNQDLNGDGDTADRIMQVWDAAAGRLIPGTQAAEDFVLGNTLLAFRTREAAQGNTDLNGDGDTKDDVLQVYDLNTRQRLNTGQAVTPCMLEACDPRVPYRVLSDTVKFLTFEADQSEDLNGNGTATDLVLQTFNVRMAEQQGGVEPLVRQMSAAQRYARTQRQGAAVMAAPQTTLGATSAGVCTNTGRSCASAANCPGGACFVPPGGCIRSLGMACDPSALGACPAGQFCQPTVGSANSGTCSQVENNRSGVPGCQSDSDCVPTDTCNSADENFERLVGPLAEATGNVVFTSSGLCVEAVTPAAMCTTDGECAAGDFCGKTGSCQRAQGLCKLPTDCPAGAPCTFGLLIATDRDSDGDEIPDRFDNCPMVPNVTQEDVNNNGVGDACDLCGNGTIDPGEQCDDGATGNGDGCSTSCQIESGFMCTGQPSVCVALTPTATGTATPTATATQTVTSTAAATPTATPGFGCPATAANTCFSAGKSKLLLKTDPDPARRKFLWKWSDGTAQLAQADFGDPVHGSTSYALCVYDQSAGSPALKMSAQIAPGGICHGQSCWKPLAAFGWSYWDHNSGIKMPLKGGAAGTPSVIFKQKSPPELPTPVSGTQFFNQDTAVIVQLHSSSPANCWSSTFDVPSTKRNDATMFKAKQSGAVPPTPASPTPAPPTPAPRRVFVTSATYTGNLGGLSGADAICQAHASAASLTGMYKAWLADDSDSPSTRLTHSTGTYVLVDGTVVADDWADLTDGSIQHAIDKTESNGAPPATDTVICGPVRLVWTNVAIGGGLAHAGNDCTNWTNGTSSPDYVVFGDSFRADSGWTYGCQSAGAICSALASLYCFEQ